LPSSSAAEPSADDAPVSANALASMLAPEPNTSPAICANEPIAALDGLEVSTAAKAAPPPAWLSLERPGADE
jgi:hypothetical protein